jgi:type IV pilus assembly protein PilC
MEKLLAWVSKWIELSTLMWIDDIQRWKENPYFPIELASVIKIWEQTWRTAELLLKISNKFNKEIDEFVKNLQTAIEPIVIIWVWLIVWTLIMAIMLPFFNMVNVV